MEQLRRAMVESMTALQAENTRKLDEIRHTVDEQLQDALQKRVTESFKAVNQQLEQVYKGLGEMQSLAAGVGGLKQVLSGRQDPRHPRRDPAGRDLGRDPRPGAV